ncbi:Hypothetical protein FKW44_004674 [Caligus rogercresseyi]|uniref:Uncharacterized protein n=1 Tax=Caligus rogercresseyi TaxID=217165 RepID=A0A7T8HMG7_CALRO|nr:Hypothetical protein FKW44_004674 [Caligus rogercresseyi]
MEVVENAEELQGKRKTEVMVPHEGFFASWRRRSPVIRLRGASRGQWQVQRRETANTCRPARSLAQGEATGG